MKTFLLLLFPLLLLACTPSQYSHAEFLAMQESGIRIMDDLKGDSSIMYRMFEEKEDGGTSIILWRKTHSLTYYRLQDEAPASGVYWQKKLLRICAMMGQPRDTARWVLIRDQADVEDTDQPRISYQDAKPDALAAGFAPPEKEGLYQWNGQELLWEAPLTNYCSFHDLPSGRYLLTPPGIFYEEAIPIDEMDQWKR